MPDADSHLPGGIYCRKCGYDLRGQAGDGAHRCPECGRGFDPADGKTFLTRPPRGAAWRWAKRGVIGLMAVGILLGMAWAWLYWGWKSEQAALAKLGAKVRWVKPLGGDRLQGYLGSAGWVLDRVDSVTLPKATTDADLARLKELHRLHDLSLSVRINVTDAGLVHVKELKRLQWLDLGCTRVTDAGLTRLADLKELKEIHLYYTRVTDVGLVRLKELRGLTWLNLTGTNVTAAGVADLQAALPGARIIWP